MTRSIKLDPKSAAVWEENIKILNTFQPALASRLEKDATARGALFEHAESREKNGSWIRDLTPKPFFQSDAFSPLPWKDAEQASGSVLFIYGAGAVPWLYTLLRSLPVGLASVVVIEPSLSLLAYTLHSTAVFRLLPKGCRLSFITSAQDEEIREALRWGIMDMGTYLISRLAVYCHPGETTLWRKEFEEIQSEIRSRLVAKLFQLGNSMEDTLLGLRQMTLVSPWIALGPRLESIKDLYRDRPFTWVASGPSLNKNFQVLKECRNRGIIVCADTTAAKLLENGIVPHIVVALERGRAVHYYMERLRDRFPEETRQILLAVQAVCVPEVAGGWPGPVVVVGKSELSLDRWIVRDIAGGDLLVSGLSVAHMGVWLCAFLGASCIALVGQDLAFAPGRISHASGTVTSATAAAEASGEYRVLEKTLRVPGALGETVESHETWRVFLSMMEEYVPLLGRPLFDCTEGGALIRGTTIMPLRQWLETHLAPLAPFDLTPAQAVRDRLPDEAARTEKASGVAYRAQKALQDLEGASKALEDIARQVERTAAPALPPAKRRHLSEGVYQKLDAFHRDYPVMDFMTQGLSGANALDILRNRQLNDVPALKAWTSALDDLVNACRVSLHFMKKELRCLASAVSAIAEHWNEGYSLAPMPHFPPGSVRDLNGLEEALGVPQMEDVLNQPQKSPDLLDNLLARADHKWWHFWDVRADWKIARHLAAAGRFTEAAFHMDRFDVAELRLFGFSEQETNDFRKEYVEFLSAPDLCRETDWEKVFRLLDRLPPSGNSAQKFPSLKERDSRRKARILESTRGTLFVDYAPPYVVEELSGLVSDATRLSGVALYNKERIEDFSPPHGRPTHS